MNALLILLVLACCAPALMAAPGSCRDLRSVTEYGFSIATAQEVAASGETPAHCRVTGLIVPDIGFELALPAQAAWNRRFLMLGNGGYAGTMDLRGLERGARNGFATIVMDTGHNSGAEPLGSFAQSRQKLFDYAFRSLHVTAVTAKNLIGTYYGAAPAKSYFHGCSTGGRQALILAQRFPEDFDGIVAGAPVLSFTGTMLRYIANHRAMQKAPISSAQARGALTKAVYAKCANADGVIEDPRQCRFDPERDLPACPGSGATEDCFTAAQIQTLKAIYSPVMSNGQHLEDGWVFGAEPAWENWLVKESGRPLNDVFSETFFRYLATSPNPRGMDYETFDLDRDVPKLAWIRSVLDADDPDLSAFRARGGRMVMYFGWADPALNPLMALKYYESVVAKMGETATPGFFRFFTVPGMFHCAGGVGCGTADWLTPVVDWVEKGSAPDRILTSKVVEGKTVMTRPVCPWPRFVCATP